MTHTFDIERFRFVAYYYASAKGAFIEVQKPGTHEVVKTVYVANKRAARKLCTENKWTAYNF